MQLPKGWITKHALQSGDAYRSSTNYGRHNAVDIISEMKDMCKCDYKIGMSTASNLWNTNVGLWVPITTGAFRRQKRLSFITFLG